MKSRHLGRTSPDIEYFLHIAGPRTMEFQPFKDFIISFYPLIIHYWIFFVISRRGSSGLFKAILPVVAFLPSDLSST